MTPEDAAEEDLPGWLPFLAFGDEPGLRFPMILMGVAILGLLDLLEAVDGWERHLEHIVPFTLAMVAGLAFRWHLTRQYPRALGPT